MTLGQRIEFEETSMECPKCRAKMVPLNVRGYEIDRCSNCKGLWFDNMECDELTLLDNPEIIDIGDAGTGKRFNQALKVQCPRCQIPLGRLVPEDQSGVWYDGCSQCRGLFFDAGEFRDYIRNNTVLSFKNLRPPGS